MTHISDQEFSDARSHLASSQQLREELFAAKNAQPDMQREQPVGMPGMEQMQQQEAPQGPQNAPGQQEPQAPQEVPPAPKEEASKAMGEADAVKEMSVKIAEATDMLKQSIDGLTAATKEIAPQKSNLREKLKGLLKNNDA